MLDELIEDDVHYQKISALPECTDILPQVLKYLESTKPDPLVSLFLEKPQFSYDILEDN